MLTVRGLGVAPPGAAAPVLRGVSLDVAPGEWLAITGPNGCGKTSLALTLAGLLPPREGTLTWRGHPLGARGVHDARGAIGAILQDPSAQLLQPTVERELAFTGANVERSPAELARDAEAWLPRFDLERDLAIDPRALSAGRQQLVLVLAALFARPELLVADEAAAHLDAANRATLLTLLREQTERGLAIVWVTQNEEELGWADRVLRIGGHAPARAVAPAREPGGGDSGSILARLHVTRPLADSGPRVEIRAPLEIALPERGIVALSGPNGSGKSVLLQTLAGLLELPQVVIEWRRPARWPLLVSQYPEQQIFEERVSDELVFAAKSRGREAGDARRGASEMLETLGFSGPRMLSARTWSLSSGEKRLVEVVAALVAPTDLLLLDEPTAGLDRRRADILGELVRRRAGEIAIVVASQDLDWVEAIGGRLLNLGRTPPNSR